MSISRAKGLIINFLLYVRMLHQLHQPNYRMIFFYLPRQPPEGQGLVIHEVSISHTQTHHTCQDSSRRVISSSQRPLPDDKQLSQKTNIHAPGEIRTHSLSRRAVAELRLRPRGHRDRHRMIMYGKITLDYVRGNLGAMKEYESIILNGGAHLIEG